MRKMLGSIFILFLVGNSYGFPNSNLESWSEGVADVIVARDETGKILTTVYRYQNDGIQIEKPNSDSDPACYIREIEHKGKNGSTCFTSIPVPVDKLDSEELRENCEGRPVFLLRPIDCQRQRTKSETRRRRENDYDCVLVRERTVVCAEEKKSCCKWICFVKKCTKCLRTEEKDIYVEKCGFDI